MGILRPPTKSLGMEVELARTLFILLKFLRFVLKKKITLGQPGLCKNIEKTLNTVAP